jgi:Amt family ammonium transporter
MVGKRIGYGKEALTPHSLTLTMVGASLLWVGWFGFNAGSNLEANGGAGLAQHQSPTTRGAGGPGRSSGDELAAASSGSGGESEGGRRGRGWSARG